MPSTAHKNETDERITMSPGDWTVPASILTGAAIASAFEPALILIVLGALVWLIVLHRIVRARFRALHKLVEDLREESESSRSLVSLFGSVIDSADVPIISTDLGGTIVQANGAAKKILGSGRALIGDHFHNLVTQREIQELEQLARQGESNHARLDLPVGGSIRVFDVAVDPIPLTGGSVCTFTDITELMQSVELKADFAANASHELRTPIASIKGAIETLQGPARNDEVMSEKLRTIIASNAERLELMVQDLLDLSKLESGAAPATITRIDTHEIINAVCAPFAPVCARKSLEISTRIDPAVGVIESDQTMLVLILRNLIENATKFAREETTIKVTLEPMKIGVDEASPPPQDLRAELGVRLRVRDKGIGIPISHQARIFERFYQVDEARSGSSAKRGTGLGLAIVKHVARTLGGNVLVESVVGQGTTMIVDLPRCVPADQNRPTPVDAPGVDPSSGTANPGDRADPTGPDSAD